MKYLLRRTALEAVKMLPRVISLRLLQLLLQAYRLQVVAPYGQSGQSVHRIIIYPSGVFMPIVSRREYGERETLFMRKFLTPDMIVFDVGANIGAYTLLFCECLVGGSGHVFSFEPVEETFRQLEDNIAINRVPRERVSVYKTALFDRNGYLQINQYDQWEFSGLNTAADRDLRMFGKPLPQTVEAVPCQTIDSFVAENGIRGIHLIKIDVEGAELAVLKGATHTIRDCLKNRLFVIMIEVSDHTLVFMKTRAADLLGYARQLGLEVCDYAAEKGVLVPHREKTYYVNDNLILCADMNEINSVLLRD